MTDDAFYFMTICEPERVADIDWTHNALLPKVFAQTYARKLQDGIDLSNPMRSTVTESEEAKKRGIPVNCVRVSVAYPMVPA